MAPTGGQEVPEIRALLSLPPSPTSGSTLAAASPNGPSSVDMDAAISQTIVPNRSNSAMAELNAGSCRERAAPGPARRPFDQGRNCGLEAASPSLGRPAEEGGPPLPNVEFLPIVGQGSDTGVI